MCARAGITNRKIRMQRRRLRPVSPEGIQEADRRLPDRMGRYGTPNQIYSPKVGVSMTSTVINLSDKQAAMRARLERRRRRIFTSEKCARCSRKRHPDATVCPYHLLYYRNRKNPHGRRGPGGRPALNVESVPIESLPKTKTIKPRKAPEIKSTRTPEHIRTMEMMKLSERIAALKNLIPHSGNERRM